MPTPPVFRFGPFLLDVAAYELRKEGLPVRLERQPMDLLLLLVERRRQLVTRAEIADRLWGQGVFVDADAGIHTAVRKVRQALGDSPDAPAFVETVPGRGYRFIAEVEDAGAPAPEPAEPVVKAPGAAEPESPDVASEAGIPAGSPSAGPWWPPGVFSTTLGIIVAAVLAWAGWTAWSRAERTPTADGGARPPLTLAVLPFANLSGNADYDYIAEGLAEETSTSLGQIDPQRLGVVARTATLRYKGSEKATAVIGRELGADYLVESALRVEGPRLRVTSRLVRVSDQLQLWSQAWEREPKSLLGVQRELSEAIAEQVRVRLSADRARSLASRESSSPDAYDLYLRGRNFENQRTPEANRRAIDYYSRATVVDPGYTLAWARISLTLAGSLLNGDARPQDVVPRARQAARRAVETGPEASEAQQALAYLQWCCDWEWGQAEAGFRRALAITPRSAWIRLILGHLLSQKRRHREARESARYARELDPLDPLMSALSSQVEFQARNNQEALDLADRAIALDGEFWIGYMMRGQALEQLGQIEPALEALTTAIRFSGQNSKPLSLRAYVLARSGRADQAAAILDTLQTVSRERYVPPYAFALIAAGLGHHDEALDWLERAVDVRDVHVIYLPVDPKWDPYRADPRFDALMTRCGFSHAGVGEAQAVPARVVPPSTAPAPGDR